MTVLLISNVSVLAWGPTRSRGGTAFLAGRDGSPTVWLIPRWFVHHEMMTRGQEVDDCVFRDFRCRRVAFSLLCREEGLMLCAEERKRILVRQELNSS
jgi:hypothetical protein